MNVVRKRIIFAFLWFDVRSLTFIYIRLSDSDLTVPEIDHIEQLFIRLLFLHFCNLIIKPGYEDL